MYKLGMFQARFGKVDEFGWCNMDIIVGTQLTSKEFQKGISVSGVKVELSTLDYQEMNVQFEVAS